MIKTNCKKNEQTKKIIVPEGKFHSRCCENCRYSYQWPGGLTCDLYKIAGKSVKPTDFCNMWRVRK